MSTSACSPCGEIFTGLTAFDRHQDVDYSRRPAVTCLDPASVGLVRNDLGRWGEPLDAAGRERLANLAASRAVPGVSGTPQGSEGSDLSYGAVTS